VKKYDKQDQRAMAIWAADCAERVISFFENAYPKDERPRKAIEACREWVGTEVFKMSVIRGASLSAHAAAREAKENKVACFAARAAGQAVATAHVSQHAFGAAYYALKAVEAADLTNAEFNVAKELDWQLQHAPKNLREAISKTVIVQKDNKRVNIKIQKGDDF
jgi:hypothetical protein